MRRAAVPLLAVLVLVAGCGQQAAIRPAKVMFSLGSSPVVGVDMYAFSNYPPAVVRADGTRMLAYIKDELKANAVGIVWDFYVTNRYSDAVRSTAATLSARDVTILTRIAERDGLRVEYRPLIFIMTTGMANPWEGLITPIDPARWFASYYRAELPYLRAAQHLGVGEFVTATEMHDLNGSPLWPSFFARVSRVYHGEVSYTAWNQDYFYSTQPLLPVWDLGMDMYHSLNLPATATTAQVTSAWEQFFGNVSPAVLRRTAIDETGISARAGAYQTPPNMWTSGVPDQDVQANWYIAACRTVRRYHLRGVFFWKVDLTDNPAHPATSLSTFEGKEGAVAISECAKIVN
jgi:hypothetical protein